MPVLADYFMAVTVSPTVENIGLKNPLIVVVDRYPIEDHKKHRFPENSQYCCIPGNAIITFIKKEKRRPYFFSFCFTLDDGSRSYGTSLFYYEKMKINGEYHLDKKGCNLYVPRALCVLSHQPIFSAFNVFLRELYRHSILDSEDRFADEKPDLRRVDSFEALLRKGSICDTLTESEFTQLPLERHIRHFVDNCPSLEYGTHIQVDYLSILPNYPQITVFQKILRIRTPPSSCLPFIDKLCFECLFTSLSSKNIAKSISLLLQEKRILLVSSQEDSLTLCAVALSSLLYPIKWNHPFVPVLPLSMTESISAFFPFLFGVTNDQFNSDDCQMNLDGVSVIHLDYDKVVLPNKSTIVEFRKSFIRRLEKQMEQSIPPPSTRVLYCNNRNIGLSTFLIFEIVFGPGRLGLRLKSRICLLCDDDEMIECAYISPITDDDEDEYNNGPGRQIELLKREPVVLSINRINVIGKGYKEVRKIMLDMRRPMVVRFQVGTAPSVIKGIMEAQREEGEKEEKGEKRKMEMSPSSSLFVTPSISINDDDDDDDDRQSYHQMATIRTLPSLIIDSLSTTSLPPSLPLPSVVTCRVTTTPPSSPPDLLHQNIILSSSEDHESSQQLINQQSLPPSLSPHSLDHPSDDLSIFFTNELDTPVSQQQPWSPVIPTPRDEDNGRVLRFYHYVSPGSTEIEGEKDEEKILDFIESIRITFLCEFCRLFGHYKDNFRSDLLEGARMAEILHKKGFFADISDDDYSLMKIVYNTQDFCHFIEDSFEFEDNYETRLFDECVGVLNGMKEMGDMYLRRKLLPSEWKLIDVSGDLVDGDGLNDEWVNDELMRDMDRFPRLNGVLYGKKKRRMRVCGEKERESIVPNDMKKTKKRMKERKKEL